LYNNNNNNNNNNNKPLHVSNTVVLIIRRSKLYYTASGIVTLCRWPSGAQVERGLLIPDAV